MWFSLLCTFLRSWGFLSSQLAISSPQKTQLWKGWVLKFILSCAPSWVVFLRAEHCPLGIGTKPPSKAVVSDCRERAAAEPWSQRQFKDRSRTSHLGWGGECKNYWPTGLRHRCRKINQWCSSAVSDVLWRSSGNNFYERHLPTGHSVIADLGNRDDSFM